jgi:hypothetical protein
MHGLRPERMWNRRPANPFTEAMRIEGLLAYVDEQMPAKPEPVYDLNALYDEALEMDKHSCPDRDCPLESWECALVNDDLDAIYDRAFEDEDYFYEERVEDNDHWLPYARSIEEVRDIFSGTDFIITHRFRY